MWSKCLVAVSAIALLAACDMKMKVGDEAGNVSANASAAGRAEEGRLTIEAPGFNMSMKIPESARGDSKIDDDKIIYPGSDFGGIHVQARPEGADGEDHGEVELRFTTADPVDRVVAWYRDPGRSGELTVASAAQQGDAFLMSGTAGDERKPFTLRLGPRTGGGTEARLLLAD